MYEETKSTNRRNNLVDTRYRDRWILGRVLDVGCGEDPLKPADWPNVTEVVPYDKIFGSGDATFLPDVLNESFDTVHSSHLLEHLANPRAALVNFLRVLKPGGYIVSTVPDSGLYEQGKWPSRNNPDHRVSWTLRAMPLIPGDINLIHMLWKLPVDVEHISLISQNWDPKKLGIDQTATNDGVEAAIEFVVRKPTPEKWW